MEEFVRNNHYSIGQFFVKNDSIEDHVNNYHDLKHDNERGLFDRLLNTIIKIYNLNKSNFDFFRKIDDNYFFLCTSENNLISFFVFDIKNDVFTRLLTADLVKKINSHSRAIVEAYNIFSKRIKNNEFVYPSSVALSEKLSLHLKNKNLTRGSPELNNEYEL